MAAQLKSTEVRLRITGLPTKKAYLIPHPNVQLRQPLDQRQFGRERECEE
jgi:hypothetical protein